MCEVFAQKMRESLQLVMLLLWIIFVGWALWQHAQQSQQPPIRDAATYYLKYLKAHNFWTEIRRQSWLISVQCGAFVKR